MARVAEFGEKPYKDFVLTVHIANYVQPAARGHRMDYDTQYRAASAVYLRATATLASRNPLRTVDPVVQRRSDSNPTFDEVASVNTSRP